MSNGLPGGVERRLINMARMACDGHFLEQMLLPIADGYQVTSLDDPNGDQLIRLAGVYWSPDCYPVAAVALPSAYPLPAQCTNAWFDQAVMAALGTHALEVVGAGCDQVFCQMDQSGSIVTTSVVDDGALGQKWIRRPRPTQHV